MNAPGSHNPPPDGTARVVARAVAIVGTFLIMAALVWVKLDATRPEAVGAVRAAERKKNLQDVRAADAVAVNEYAWRDKARGFVRVPVQRAMELAVQEWQQPGAARSNLIVRVDQATAVAPKPPEKPGAFE